MIPSRNVRAVLGRLGVVGVLALVGCTAMDSSAAIAGCYRIRYFEWTGDTGLANAEADALPQEIQLVNAPSEDGPDGDELQVVVRGPSSEYGMHEAYWKLSNELPTVTIGKNSESIFIALSGAFPSMNGRGHARLYTDAIGVEANARCEAAEFVCPEG